MASPSSPEETGAFPSASSSSRLNYLSFSSRRFRHVSQRTAAQRDLHGLSGPPPVAHSGLETTLSHILWIPWLSMRSAEIHRASPRTLIQRLARGLFLLWMWFCLAYFTAVLCRAVQRTVIDWLYDRASSGNLENLTSSTNNILETLPLEHRLSKLSSLHPVPVSLSPFVLGPRGHEDDPIVACLWTEEQNLPRLQTWASSWLGPISLLVTTPGDQHEPAHKELLATLTLLSQAAPNVSFHVLHRPPLLRNFNAYINLARLFAPSSRVLLFPPHALSLWSPLPLPSAVISSINVSHDGGLVVPMHGHEAHAVSNTTGQVDLSRADFLPSSALLIDRDSAPWCPERLFTMTTRREGLNAPSSLDTEMAAQWEECVWNVWLRMKGSMRVHGGGGWAVQGVMRVALPSVPETAETSLRVRVARRQRSETCVMVARELVAQGEWTLAAGSHDAQEGAVSTVVGARGHRVLNVKESLKAQWLRGVCKETLDRWGKEIFE